MLVPDLCNTCNKKLKISSSKTWNWTNQNNIRKPLVMHFCCKKCYISFITVKENVHKFYSRNT